MDNTAALEDFVEDLRAMKGLLEKARKEKKGLDALTPDERTLLAQFDPRIHEWESLSEKEKDTTKALSMLTRLTSMWADLGGGAIEKLTPRDTASLADLTYIFGGSFVVLDYRWSKLADISRRLERLAHKQLRQVSFSAEEESFLRDYGERLANIMFYEGHSYLHPRDDTPRIVDVYSNAKLGKHLLAGTGRPRTIWVLYPMKGKEILCRGAVLPYYEFTSTQRLTDTEWKTLLDSPHRPEFPTWIQPLMVKDGGKR
jgi:Protein of unknown function (DUF3160)